MKGARVKGAKRRRESRVGDNMTKCKGTIPIPNPQSQSSPSTWQPLAHYLILGMASSAALERCRTQSKPHRIVLALAEPCLWPVSFTFNLFLHTLSLSLTLSLTPILLARPGSPLPPEIVAPWRFVARVSSQM